MFEHHEPEIIKQEIPPSEKEGGNAFNRLRGRFKFGHLYWNSQTSFQSGSSGRGRYQVILWSWMASLIDGLFLIGMSCIFLIVFSKIVQTPAGEVIYFIRHGQGMSWLFAEIFVGTAWFYLVLLRSFFGYSIGEWACDLRLGAPHEARQNGYVAKVILRSTLTIVTGIVTLPIFSFLLGRDIAGHIAGVRIVSLR